MLPGIPAAFPANARPPAESGRNVCRRPRPEQFPFEMLRISNHTACRFAERGFSAHSGPGGAVPPPRVSSFSKLKFSIPSCGMICGYPSPLNRQRHTTDRKRGGSRSARSACPFPAGCPPHEHVQFEMLRISNHTAPCLNQTSR